MWRSRAEEWSGPGQRGACEDSEGKKYPVPVTISDTTVVGHLPAALHQFGGPWIRPAVDSRIIGVEPAGPALVGWEHRYAGRAEVGPRKSAVNPSCVPAATPELANHAVLEIGLHRSSLVGAGVRDAEATHELLWRALPSRTAPAPSGSPPVPPGVVPPHGSRGPTAIRIRCSRAARPIRTPPTLIPRSRQAAVRRASYT